MAEMPHRRLSVGDLVTARVLTHEPFGLIVDIGAEFAGASVDMISTFRDASPKAWPSIGSTVTAAVTDVRSSARGVWVHLSINPDHFHVHSDWARVKAERPLGSTVTGRLHGPFEAAYYIFDIDLPPLITARVDRNDLGVTFDPTCRLRAHGTVSGFDERSKSVLVDITRAIFDEQVDES